MKFSQQLDRIRKELIKQGYYCGSPNYSHINNGYYGIFSSRVVLLYGNRVELCCAGGIGTKYDRPFVEFSRSLPKHYFIKFEGKYYDIECIDGVKNYMDLPIFKDICFWSRVIGMFK